ncbi:hypothetical protein [Thioalkalivibrio thiocyanodenitrificans]|uniref:hypothetical protein n=1 Tax=Thioalkalivibrio thiocyanodenitrificans TaxID=243063 RepID=UPI00036446C2|nr:hypothetical protein [Thioalkalivibrio thiocyanodenitrificans]
MLQKLLALSSFHRPPAIDDQTRAWLLDVYDWALRGFEGQAFHRRTSLVTPTEADFPGKARSTHEMAELVFERVKRHAGLSHWPVRVVAPEVFESEESHSAALAGQVGVSRDMSGGLIVPDPGIQISYHPGMISDPEVLIAHFAQTLAAHLIAALGEPPPGGAGSAAHAAEVLAVFMGFGLMIANTAYIAPRVGCGGQCKLPQVARATHLGQQETTYALALFCALKGIPARRARRHLKSSLRGYFRRAMAEAADSEGVPRQGG